MPQANLSAQVDTRLKTRYRLIEIAALHISNKGIDGMSLRQVASDAGISAAAVYKHFPNGKSELYEATLGMVAEKMLSLLQATKPEKDLVQQLVSQCEQLWDFFEAYPSIAAMLVREHINGGLDGKAPSPYLEQHIEYIAVIREIIADGITQKKIKPLNISAFLFNTISFITNFHGCKALRDVTWIEHDLNQAKQKFLEQTRAQLELV